GGDPYGTSFETGKALKKSELETQEYIEISSRNPVEPADIVLVRTDKDGWKHMALVWSEPTGDECESIDGNQGHPSIARRKRSMRQKIHGGRDYSLVFLHILV